MDSQDQQSLPREATKQEIETLTHGIDTTPLIAWLLAFAGAAAQLARFGTTVAQQNYLQNPPGNKELPGALNLGESTATIIQNAFLFFQYLTPMPFTLLSDAWLGRYKTMLLSLTYTVLFVTALPSSLDHGAGLGGLIATMVLTGLGQGGLSAVMYPLIDPGETPSVKRNKKGESVWVLLYIGFWAAYLLPTCILIVTIIPVIFWNKRLVKLPPQGNTLPQAGRVLLIATRSKFHLSAADPQHQNQHYSHSVLWNSTFIDEIRRGLNGCRVVISFVVFWLCYNQTANNLMSQAGSMQSQGVSNDTIKSLNAIACIIMGPPIQHILSYSQRRKMELGPILRMTAMPPVSNSSSIRADHATTIPSNAQLHETHRTALRTSTSKQISLVSLSEYTYTEAPTNLKASVQASQAVAAALGAAIGIGLSPVSKNPWLIIMFVCLAGTMAITAVFFWAVYRGHDVDYAKADEVDAVDGKEDGKQSDDLEAVVCKKETADADSRHGEKLIPGNSVKAVEISL
ncbi:hypothetical protein BPAE_0295g00020 [Botrytis paeoniae]|uniref:Uncharacterized protein n=1 Tax=Botrytis paeoniae TaxID=278948 RepID=A0A4Z1FCC5_9HELO|nr:hypothetical protein BPAE_0295g00020 [Botrytis paeoniae]